MRRAGRVPALPGHFLAVGGGLGVLGVSAYGYLALAGRALPPQAFDSLSVVWALVHGIGLGLFMPFEQELGRRLAAAGGRASRGQLRRVLTGAGVMVAATALLAGLGSGWLSGSLFGGDRWLVLVLAGAFAALAVSFVARGLLAGGAQYRRYGLQLAVDGVLRVAGAGALAASGETSAVPYAVVLAAAPAASTLLTTGWPAALRANTAAAPAHGTDRRSVSPSVTSNALLVLVAASLLSYLLANAGPVAVRWLTGDAAVDGSSAGRFLAVLVVARAPLFLYAAVQAVLLPELARAADAVDLAGFAARFRRIMLFSLVLGAVGWIAVTLVGPLAVPLLFGEEYRADRVILALLGAGGLTMIMATAAAQGVLALHRDAWAVAGWGGALATAVGVFLLPLSAEVAVSLGLLLGPLVALAVHLESVRRRVSRS